MKAHLDVKTTKTEGHISHIEKDYNEIKMQINKQSVEEMLIGRAVKTAIQVLYDKGLFDNYGKSDEVLSNYPFIERG